jgi:DNA-binding FrmR family transcriptional regulator
MAKHAISQKQKLRNRVRRLRGQVEALERILDADAGCAEVMQLLTACRGAIGGLMAEVVEDHIRMHMIDPVRKATAIEAEAADELVSVLHSYIK